MSNNRTKKLIELATAKLTGGREFVIPNEFRHYRVVDGVTVYRTVCKLVRDHDVLMRNVPDSDLGKYGVWVVKTLVTGLSANTGKEIVYYRAFKRRKDAKAKAEEWWWRYYRREQEKQARARTRARTRAAKAHCKRSNQGTD